MTGVDDPVGSARKLRDHLLVGLTFDGTEASELLALVMKARRAECNIPTCTTCRVLASVEERIIRAIARAM